MRTFLKVTARAGTCEIGLSWFLVEMRTVLRVTARAGTYEIGLS